MGDVINFKVDIEVLKCPKERKDRFQTIQIYPVGINESLIIDLEMLCECDCEKPGDKVCSLLKWSENRLLDIFYSNSTIKRTPQLVTVMAPTNAVFACVIPVLSAGTVNVTPMKSLNCLKLLVAYHLTAPPVWSALEKAHASADGANANLEDRTRYFFNFLHHLSG